MFVCCGILFNHESEFRQRGFVSKKIVDGAVAITRDRNHVLPLGNLGAERDWGYAGDYMRAVFLMMQQNKASDYVVSTGEKRSVKEFLETTFRILDIEDRLESNVSIDSSLLRRNEIKAVVGNSQKAHLQLGWKPKISFDQMIKIMIEASLKEDLNSVN